MTNVVRPAPQVPQAVLDQRLALAVEARGRLVEDQDRRVGEDRARDRDALALAAGELDAALADHRVVALLELRDELVAVRDAADALDLRARRVRPREGDVLGDRAVEEEVVLQHDAEVRAVVAQADRRRGRGRRRRTRPESGRLKAITRLISVLLPEPEEPTSAVVEPAGGVERDAACSTGTPGLYSNETSSKAMSPRTSGSGALVASSSSSVARRRISRMRSRPAKASVICVPIDEICTSGAAIRPVKKMYMTRSPSVIVPARIALPPTSIITTPSAPTTTVAKALTPETAGHRAGDVAEELVRALGEDQLLALLGGVGLDDADAAERLDQPAGDLGVDLAALAEQRPQALEGERHRAAEGEQGHQIDRASASS